MSERDQLEVFWSGDDETLGYTEDEIRDYLSGKMTGADLDEFNFSLQDTPELQVYVAALRHEMEIERRQAEAKRVAAARPAMVVEPVRREKRWSFATWSGLGFAALGGIFMVVAFMSLSQQQGQAKQGDPGDKGRLAELEGQLREFRGREDALKQGEVALKSGREKLDEESSELRKETAQATALVAEAELKLKAADQKVPEAVGKALEAGAKDVQDIWKGDGETADGSLTAWFQMDPSVPKQVRSRTFLLKWKSKPPGLPVFVSVGPNGGPSSFKSGRVTADEVLVDLGEMPPGRTYYELYVWKIQPVDSRYGPMTGSIVRIATPSE